jgi:hypothetical protein
VINAEPELAVSQVCESYGYKIGHVAQGPDLQVSIPFLPRLLVEDKTVGLLLAAPAEADALRTKEAAPEGRPLLVANAGLNSSR